MKIEEAKISLSVYGILGKGLCALAGGIVGYILSGPLLAILGAAAGLTIAQLLEKSLVTQEDN